MENVKAYNNTIMPKQTQPLLVHCSLSTEHEHKCSWYTIVAYPIYHSVGQSVCLSVRKLYCSKMADWIRMPFGVVCEVSWEIGVLDGGNDHQTGRGSFGGKCGVSHCNRRGLCCIVVRKLSLGLVSGVSRGMGVLDGGPRAQQEG